jgi:hypothetical protein
MHRERTSTAPWLIVAGAAVVLAYAWIAAGFLPFTQPEELVVALPVIPVIILAARRGRSAAEPALGASPEQGGAVVWVGLFAALLVWELIALFSSPRSQHPTMSYLTDRIMSVHVGRTAVFLLWLLLGGALALRPMWRRDP